MHTTSKIRSHISLNRVFSDYLNRSANRCRSLVIESSFFLKFLVEFALGCIFQDEIDTGGVVEITVQPQNMWMPGQNKNQAYCVITKEEKLCTEINNQMHSILESYYIAKTLKYQNIVIGFDLKLNSGL